MDGDRLATFVEAGQEPSSLAGQFLVQVEAAAGAEVSRIEAAIFDVISELARTGPNPEELLRSRHRLEAAWRWEQEDLPGLASGLGHVALWRHWRDWQAEHRECGPILQIPATESEQIVAACVHSTLATWWPGTFASLLASDRQ